MKNIHQFLLNIIALGSFILYSIGIYFYVEVYGEWGNIAVDFAINTVGLLAGVIIVTIVGGFILFFTFFIKKLKNLNIFLCWFWIISLYQCAINTFLQIAGRPDEPINQFFKWLFPNFWYPAKELFFLALSLLLTFIWVKKIAQTDFSRLDSGLIVISAFILVGGTVISQILLLS